MADSSTTQERRGRRPTRPSRQTKNTLIFLFFFAMASVFWIIQKLDEPVSVTVTVPVKLVNVPQEVIIVTELPSEIQAVVHDKGNEILPLFWRPRLDTLYVDFTAYDTHEITGSATLVPSVLSQLLKEKLPPQSNIAEMTPDTLLYAFNRGMHRQLQVRLRGSLTANEQYNLDSYAFFPDSVDVYAPAHVLDTLRAAYTETTILEDLKGNATFRVPLMHSRAIRFFPDTVKLRANVDILLRKNVEIYVQGTGFPENKELHTYPATVTVTYLVSAAQAKNVDIGQFRVTVAYSDLNESATVCQPVLERIPENVSNAFFTPMQVEYLVEDIIPASVEEQDVQEEADAETDGEEAA